MFENCTLWILVFRKIWVLNLYCKTAPADAYYTWLDTYLFIAVLLQVQITQNCTNSYHTIHSNYTMFCKTLVNKSYSKNAGVLFLIILTEYCLPTVCNLRGCVTNRACVKCHQSLFTFSIKNIYFPVVLTNKKSDFNMTGLKMTDLAFWRWSTSLWHFTSNSFLIISKGMVPDVRQPVVVRLGKEVKLSWVRFKWALFK